MIKKVYLKIMKFKNILANEIHFHPVDEKTYHVIPYPKPARNYLPKWYKDMPLFHNDEFKMDQHGSNVSAKACVPFMDALTTGYVQETWCDIVIDTDLVGNVIYHSLPEFPIMHKRGYNKDQNTKVFVPEDFYGDEFIWKVPWFPRTPKGWSSIFTHPLGRMDLPFYSMSGVVDTDKFWGSGGNYPFFIKKGFKGIIPAGTPMYQIIPFKRSDWNSKAIEHDEGNFLKMEFSVKKHVYGGYKKEYWNKKRYD